MKEFASDVASSLSSSGLFDECGTGNIKPMGLAKGVEVGCFPQLYEALSGNMPDQIITL